MTGRAHPGVDAYIAKLPEWQQSICEQLREIIWATDPEIEETIKRTVQPYFVLEGNVCALLATKDHDRRVECLVMGTKPGQAIAIREVDVEQNH